MVIHNPKNDAILRVDANTPKAREIALERFGLSLTVIAAAVNALKKTIDFLECLLILRLPVQIIIPSLIKPILMPLRRPRSNHAP